MEEENQEKIYDLEERTAAFGEAIIDFAKKVPRNVITFGLIKQVVASGTSVGANYCEADCAESIDDFIHKIGISKKESKETKFHLRMIVRAEPQLKEEALKLKKEAEELNLIFITIARKARITKQKREEEKKKYKSRLQSNHDPNH